MKTITIYDYHKDVQPVLCKALGIEEKYFREYQEIDPSPDAAYLREEKLGIVNKSTSRHKDLWHLWIEYIDEGVRNDSVSSIYVPEEDLKEGGYLYTTLAYEYGVWAIEPFRKMRKALENFGNPGDVIYIEYSW